MAQTWFITGSSVGLGYSIVEAALAAGHQVVATARNPQTLDKLVERYPGRLLTLPLDVGVIVDWEKAIAAATDRFGGIDVLVNNAGFGGVGSVKDIPVEIKGLDRRRLFRVLDCIEANLEGDLTLDHLASIACLSRFHFARAFKAALGKTPHQHVTARRIELAKALLRRRERSLVDVALALNFSCQANFTRAFRRLTGQTPGQYRSSFRLQ